MYGPTKRAQERPFGPLDGDVVRTPEAYPHARLQPTVT